MRRFQVSLASVVLGLSLAAMASRAEAQTQVQQPNGTQQGGRQQTPWFAAPEVRQQFKLNDDQFSQLNRAYQDSWSRYQKSINELDKNLTPDQRNERMRELNQGFQKEFSNSTNNVFNNPEQRQRYNQLNWQYRGYGAFEDPTVAEQLKLTPEQRTKLSSFNQDWNRQMTELAPSYQTNRDDATNRFTKMRSEMGSRINTVLTPEQQRTWQQMVGETYNFPPSVYFSGQQNTPNNR